MEEFIELAKKNLLFKNITSEEIKSIAPCLNPKKKSYKASEYIYDAGDFIVNIGLINSGSVLLIEDDYWGNRNIIRHFSIGEFFGEAYALSRTPLNLSVIAKENCEIFFINVNAIMHTCNKNCSFHNVLINNFISLLAKKNILLSSKMENVTKRNTKEKIMSYLSSYSKLIEQNEFSIPFDRQQFADYLCVDRSALSSELSKLKAKKLIDFKKNHFILL